VVFNILLLLMIRRIATEIQNGGILVLAYPGSPGKWPLNDCYAPAY